MKNLKGKSKNFEIEYLNITIRTTKKNLTLKKRIKFILIVKISRQKD